MEAVEKDDPISFSHPANPEDCFVGEEASLIDAAYGHKPKAIIYKYA